MSWLRDFIIVNMLMLLLVVLLIDKISDRCETYCRDAKNELKSHINKCKAYAENIEHVGCIKVRYLSHYCGCKDIDIVITEQGSKHRTEEVRARVYNDFYSSIGSYYVYITAMTCHGTPIKTKLLKTSETRPYYDRMGCEVRDSNYDSDYKETHIIKMVDSGYPSKIHLECFNLENINCIYTVMYDYHNGAYGNTSDTVYTSRTYHDRWR